MYCYEMYNSHICCALARSVPTWTDCLRKAEAPMDKNGSCTFERQEEKAGTDPLYTMQPLHCAMKLAARVSAKQ